MEKLLTSTHEMLGKMLIELACIAIVLALLVVFFAPRFTGFAALVIAFSVVAIFIDFATTPEPLPSNVGTFIKYSDKDDDNDAYPSEIIDHECAYVKHMSQIAIEPNPYTPQQVSSVYRGAIPFDGTGQKIAIITCFAQPGLQKDFDTFNETYTQPNSQLEIFEFSKLRDSGWEIETRLDTQWLHVFAPNARIGVFAAATNSYANLKVAILEAVKWGATVVSMSLGSSESSYVATLLEPIFSGNPNIIFMASSGDDPSVSYPSSSPNVISVGGTRLYIKEDGMNTSSKPKTINGVYKKEGEIDWTSHRGIGTGHGISALFDKPLYQATANTSSRRSVPDFSCISATPSENGLSILYNGKWMGAQGTSAGCPIAAGLIASANSTRLKPKKKALTRVDVMKSLYNLHPPNSPVDTMADGAGFINHRLVEFLVSL